ncbi:MAG TPA: catalase family peroxidase [Amycolatopsis sp.]|jgi:catalase|nr:catalase family peroxidase [Amycolatopsis sp.]
MTSQQYDTTVAERAVDAIEHAKGRFPGYRRAHARGTCYTATFTPSGDALPLTAAAHLTDVPVPATVRFSHSDTNPHLPDAGTSSRGFAVKFHLPDGHHTDLVSVNLPVFFASSAESFIEFTEATTRDPVTGQPDQTRLAAYLQRHPEAAPCLQAAATQPTPASYATAAYWAIHAFVWVNGSGARQAIRYHWIPEAGIENVTPEAAETWTAEQLTGELVERLANGPVAFRLEVQLAEPGDITGDPTREWPPDRPRIAVGTLTITAPVDDQDHWERQVFDPTTVTDGIELSDDPILAGRRHFYTVSYNRRSSER